MFPLVLRRLFQNDSLTDLGNNYGDDDDVDENDGGNGGKEISIPVHSCFFTLSNTASNYSSNHNPSETPQGSLVNPANPIRSAANFHSSCRAALLFACNGVS